MKRKPGSIYRNSFRIGRAARPLYTAKFEGGVLDGRQQAMYGRSRSFPRSFLNMREHRFHDGVTFKIVDDYYVCTTPNKRVEVAGEVRIYRNEPNYVLPLE